MFFFSFFRQRGEWLPRHCLGFRFSATAIWILEVGSAHFSEPMNSFSPSIPEIRKRKENSTPLSPQQGPI